MTIHIAVENDQVAACFPVVVQLRPHLTYEQFIKAVELQRAQGYVLVYGEVDGRVVSVAGYRIIRMLSRGKCMYIDDLVTDADCRSHGYGQKMFEWLTALARRERCRRVDLDTGVQMSGAQRFYFSQRMTMPGFHFILMLDETLPVVEEGDS